MGTRRPIEVPLQADQRRSLDFVSDQMTDGRRFRILTVVDNCTRECLALVADTSLSELRVAREFVTCPPCGPAFETGVRQQETDDAEIEVQRGADHRRAA